MLLQAFGYVAMKVLSLNYPVCSARSRDRVIGDMYMYVCVWQCMCMDINMSCLSELQTLSWIALTANETAVEK